MAAITQNFDKIQSELSKLSDMELFVIQNDIQELDQNPNTALIRFCEHMFQRGVMILDLRDIICPLCSLLATRLSKVVMSPFSVN